jgi:hypothetical protein
LPDWVVRWLAWLAAVWVPVAALAAAGVLIYVHKYTYGVVMRWFMIPIAVSIALGFVGLRLIDVGKSVSLSAPQAFLSKFPNLWIDEGDTVLPEPQTALLPEVVPPLPEPEPTLVCEDMSDTPANCVPVGAKVSTAMVEPLPPPVAKTKLQKKAKRKVRKVNTVSPQDYFCAGFQC